MRSTKKFWIIIKFLLSAFKCIMMIVCYENRYEAHLNTAGSVMNRWSAPLTVWIIFPTCEERSQLLPLTCQVLCLYFGHCFISRDRTAITNVNWPPFLRIVWDPAAGCNLNKHKGNRAFDIRSTSAPGRGEGAPDPHVSPQKKEELHHRCAAGIQRLPHRTSTPPSSLSLCARVAQQVAEIRLLSKDRFHCESTSTTLWITVPLFAAAAQQKTWHGSVIFKNEGLFLEIKYEHRVNVHNQPANTDR